LPSGGSVSLRYKSGVSDRHSRFAGATQSVNLGIELLRERIDDAGAKSGFWLGKTPSGLPIPLSATESFQFVPVYTTDRKGHVSLSLRSRRRTIWSLSEYERKLAPAGAEFIGSE
jgi:hypothetical protein